MTSLLSFAWARSRASESTTDGHRRHHHDKYQHHDDEEEEVPAVTASSSGETTLSTQPSEDSTFLTSICQSPSTPEGLRPRKAIEHLRKELNLPSNLLKQLEWRPRPTACYEFSCMPDTTERHHVSQPKQQQQQQQQQPQLHLQQRQRPQQPQQILSKTREEVPPSPQISTSSFYGRSSNSDRVAASPHLKVGQAKTAVGALLAMSGNKVSFHSSTKPPCDVTGTPNKGGKSVVLPPRSWIDRQFNGVGDEEDDDGDDDEDEYTEPPYHALNDSKSHLSAFSPARLHQPSTKDITSPASTADESSVHASPSSRNWKQSYPACKVLQEEASFSRGWLMDNKGVCSKKRYDFDSILDQEFYVANHPENANNVSAISHSTKDNDSLHSLDSLKYGGLNSIVDEDDDEEEEEDDIAIYYNYGRDEDAFDEALLRRKSRNNRTAKEDLLMGILDRFQDDSQFISDVKRLLENSSTKANQHTKATLESLFAGYSNRLRQDITDKIDCVLNEMTVAAPGEFFLSPSQLPQLSETHDDLEQALRFCRKLVAAAISPSERPQIVPFPGAAPQKGHTWKAIAGLRTCMGLQEIPESPGTIRGGDTSLFSLPSDSAAATPHTSNVSVTTTITSNCSPARNRHLLLNSNNGNSTKLRRAIETCVGAMTQLNDALLRLARLSASAGAAALAADDLKQSYIKLVSMSSDDLKDVTEAFQLSLPPLQIARLVSFDPEESNNNPQRPAYLPAPPQLFRSTAPVYQITDKVSSICRDENLIREGRQDEELTLRGTLFSPATADMRSLETREIESDECQREGGDDDDDNNAVVYSIVEGEVRDSAPEESIVLDGEPVKKSKRRPKRAQQIPIKSQAAE